MSNLYMVVSEHNTGNNGRLGEVDTKYRKKSLPMTREEAEKLMHTMTRLITCESARLEEVYGD